ncbi:hypothetical protein I6I18_11580 [Kytococcus sedentarius]|nr:hypothetical protein [Kytococcus sedentarius]QQB63638.1 hypothetical protein I6I18_11580 [Kytococcus sedentarius]STX13425.1 Uncharacterised protein [Kytococcus sedentarius]
MRATKRLMFAVPAVIAMAGAPFLSGVGNFGIDGPAADPRTWVIRG